MPTYHYQCRNCGHELEEFQSMTEPVLTLCPACQTDGLMRSIGAGAGFIFKGTGFYLTDYKKSGDAAGQKQKKKDAGDGTGGGAGKDSGGGTGKDSGGGTGKDSGGGTGKGSGGGASSGSTPAGS